MQPNTFSVFVSYSREDSISLEAFKTAVDSEAKKRDIIIQFRDDSQDIVGGAEWRKRIQGMIETSDATVVLLSEAAIKSEEVKKEVKAAPPSRIIPVLIQTVEIPTWISDLQVIQGNSYEIIAKKVIEALTQAPPGEELRNLYVTSLSPKAGRTTVIHAIHNMRARYGSPGFFKPFASSNDTQFHKEVEFVATRFRIESGFLKYLVPFQSFDMIEHSDLTRAFGKINLSGTVLIEGPVRLPVKGLTFSQIINDIFHASIVLVTDYRALVVDEEEFSDIKLQIDDLRDAVGKDLRIGSVLNRVPRASMSERDDIIRKYGEILGGNQIEDLGYITDDDRLRAISFEELLESANGIQLVAPPPQKDCFIYRIPATVFDEPEVLAYYRRIVEQHGDLSGSGVIVGGGPGKLRLQLELVRLGIPALLLAGNKDTIELDNAVESTAIENGVAVAYFSMPLDILSRKFYELQNRIPIQHEYKIGVLSENIKLNETRISELMDK